MGRATAAAAVVTLVACLGCSTITSVSAFVVMPFSPRLILPPSSLSMRPAACERSACLSRPANKLVGALQAGAGSDSNNNGGNKDDLYYQRFMGMNEGEPTDDLRVAAEIADMDPSTIDSLRRGTSVDDKVNMSPSSSSSTSSNPFYIGGNSGSSSGGISSGIGSGASGFLDSMKKKSAASFSTLGGGAGGMGGGAGEERDEWQGCTKRQSRFDDVWAEGLYHSPKPGGGAIGDKEFGARTEKITERCDCGDPGEEFPEVSSTGGFVGEGTFWLRVRNRGKGNIQRKGCQSV